MPLHYARTNTRTNATYHDNTVRSKRTWASTTSLYVPDGRTEIARERKHMPPNLIFHATCNPVGSLSLAIGSAFRLNLEHPHKETKVRPLKTHTHHVLSHASPRTRIGRSRQNLNHQRKEQNKTARGNPDMHHRSDSGGDVKHLVGTPHHHRIRARRHLSTHIRNG